MNNPHEEFARLAAQLKACPSQDLRVSEASARQAWDRMKQQAWPEDYPLTAAVVTALILSSESFARLLRPAERSQLTSLSQTALLRFQEKAHPPNKLGKILASSIKEFQ